MKVKLFEWTTPVERESVEKDINELLDNGCNVVNVLQSSSPSHVSISVWYEERAENTSNRVTALARRRVHELNELLNQPLDAFGFSVRTINSLANQNITTIRGLVLKTEGDLLAYRNCGKRVILDIKARLAEHGLHLGMQV